MSRLVLLLGDQLTRSISALEGFDPARDRILMAEVASEATYVRHHKQKLVMVFSAMRHFAESLRAEGLVVDYWRIEDPGNPGSLDAALRLAVDQHRPDAVTLTEPGEWRVLEMMRDWAETLGPPVEIRPDTRFFARIEEFARWAEGRKTYRMEFFYREMRRKTGLLMEGEQPIGGQWNFDAENRKALPAGHRLPERLRFPPDALTREVMAVVEARFGGHFGSLEGFGWPVTREQALDALDHFIADALPWFGDFQDAMKRGEDFVHHALLAPALNMGLLLPEEICRAAERAWFEGQAPLNAVEGFIRQILGWREYVRGLYWLEMPGYAETNALAAHRPLPDFYWTGKTDLRCLAEVVQATARNAYAHHIQRLMVTGNFALLAGIAPKAVEEWYLLVYADAYEWVELPNTHGMALFADGGLLASKPYAASGAYIDRMSDYCTGCRYDPAVKSGPKACPFNYLYWNFLIANEKRLSGNPRMAMPYRTLAKMAPARRAEIVVEASAFLDSLPAAQ
ncbi:MAG: cryptochrome/photolyase family protein [Beijerinckiaceae bacterium]|nr:cryptochrome/photolyase family protein [Beijerinckiaceae bacterium]MCZ8301910.1 cryptochrome/photolyase family protein [Beijerinckiaceae bacterium]